MACWRSANREEQVWLVLDQSKPKGELYDILYVDLNANGDLTEPMERVVGEVQGNDVRFSLPDLKDPATGAVHSRFSARVSGASAATVMLSLMWRGRFKMGGGYPRGCGGGIPSSLADKPEQHPGDVGVW